MDDRESLEPGDELAASPSEAQSEPEAPHAPPAAASLVTRLVLTGLGGLACLFLWPAGGQIVIIALVVMAVLVWFGPWLSNSPSDIDDDALSSPPESD